MSGFMKMRDIPQGPRSFSNQARKTSAANKGAGRRGPIQGEYNSFWPNTEKALWFGICPAQSWKNTFYDREEGKVVTEEDQFFLLYKSHRIAMTGRTFYCSAGPDLATPCWGCGIRNHHFEKQRELQEATGVKPKGEPPIGGGIQHAMSGVLLENIVKVPVLDKNGKQRLSKDQKPIMRDTPLTMLTPQDQKKYKAAGGISFGLPVHYSFGSTALSELQAYDERLKSSCASCANDMYAAVACCPECLAEYQLADDPDEPLTGQDLIEARAQDYKCDSCGYYGQLQPNLLCECGQPKEGCLAAFALRLLSEKTGEKTRSLKLVEIKPIGYFLGKYPAVEAMLETPLDLPKIFAPSALQYQTMLIPEGMRGDGVSPAPRKTKGAAPAAESYSFGKDESTTEDEIPY